MKPYISNNNKYQTLAAAGNLPWIKAHCKEWKTKCTPNLTSMRLAATILKTRHQLHRPLSKPIINCHWRKSPRQLRNKCKKTVFLPSCTKSTNRKKRRQSRKKMTRSSGHSSKLSCSAKAVAAVTNPLQQTRDLMNKKTSPQLKRIQCNRWKVTRFRKTTPFQQW